MWFITLAFASIQFVDLPPTHTAYPAVQYLVEHNILKGNENNQFLPDAALTRAEALKIALLAHGTNPPPANTPLTFTDIETDHWSVPFIKYALEKAIVRGYEDQTFRPNQTVSRAEGIKILLSAFEIKPSPTDTNTYSDVTADNWFFPYAHYLEQTKLWQTPSPLFEPNKPLTRGEMAQLAYQLILQTNAKSTPIIPVWAAIIAILLWTLTSYISLPWWRTLFPQKHRRQLIGAILTGPVSSLLATLKELIPKITIYEHAASNEDSHLHPIKALLTPRKIGLELYQYLVVKCFYLVKLSFLFLINFFLAHILIISYYSYLYRYSFTF